MLEERRGLANTLRQLDDLDTRARILADRAWSGAAAHADHEHVFRIAVQHHRQVTDGAVQQHHARLIVGLVEAVEIQHVLKLRCADADRGLRTLVTPELQQPIRVAALDRDLERIRQPRARAR